MTLQFLAGNRIQGSGLDKNYANFSDDYTTNTGWTTQAGTLITVDSSTADKLAGASVVANADHRVSKSLGLTLSDSLWCADFELNVSAMGAGSQGFIVWFSAGTGKPRDGVTDGLGVFIQEPAGTEQIAIIKSNGGTLTVSTVMTLPMSTLFYCRLERTSTTNAKLSVFTDSERTIHQSGSPISYTIDSTITSLTTLQHASDDGGGTANAWSGTIDNMKVYNGTITPTDKLLVLQDGARFEETDTELIYSLTTSTTFSDDFSSSTGWTLTGSATISGGVLATGTYADIAPVAIKSLGFNLNDVSWTVDFDFKMNSDGGNSNTSVFFSFADHNDVRSSGGSGDSISALMHNLDGTIVLHKKENTSTITSGSASASGLSLTTQYYMRMIRTGTTITLYAYTDSGRTTLHTSCTLSVTSNLNTLNRICIGSSEATPSNASANCTIDNISITQNPYWWVQQ